MRCTSFTTKTRRRKETQRQTWASTGVENMSDVLKPARDPLRWSAPAELAEIFVPLGSRMRLETEHSDSASSERLCNGFCRARDGARHGVFKKHVSRLPGPDHADARQGRHAHLRARLGGSVGQSRADLQRAQPVWKNHSGFRLRAAQIQRGVR